MAIASVAGVAAIVTGSACSSTKGGASGSGVAEEKKIAELNDAEMGKLCDYLAARFGGYGASSTQTCASGTRSLKAPANQAACVEGFLVKVPDTCPMKVSEAETCFAELASPSCERPAGEVPASCVVLTQPICGPVLGGVTTSPPVDGGGPEASVDASDATAPKACPGNTKQTTQFINTACQSALEKNCCAELTGCFNIVVATGVDDCNKYSQCIPRCRFKADGVTPEPDAAKVSACQNDCDALSTKSVVDAYDGIAVCATNHPATSAACQ